MSGRGLCSVASFGNVVSACAGAVAVCRGRIYGKNKVRPRSRSKRGEGPELNNQPFIN